MENKELTKEIKENIDSAREEIVKKVNTLVASKSIAGGRRSHENKVVINNLRHQISKMTNCLETEKDSIL